MIISSSEINRQAIQALSQYDFSFFVYTQKVNANENRLFTTHF